MQTTTTTTVHPRYLTVCQMIWYSKYSQTCQLKVCASVPESVEDFIFWPGSQHFGKALILTGVKIWMQILQLSQF
jgi:hypothetical protein